MRSAFVKAGSAVLAVMIIALATWTFLVPPYMRDDFITIIGCMCIPPRWQPANSEALLEANGWVRIYPGEFGLYGPPGSEVRRISSQSGRIVTPRFSLIYEFGAAGFAPAGRDVIDEPVRIDGARAILRRMTIPGASEPYFAGLFVPQAGRPGGQPIPFLIYGTFRSRADRAVADSILVTVSFKPVPPLTGVVQPPPIRVEPPVFDIAPDPA